MRYLLFFFAATLLLTACDRKLPPPSEEEREAILQDAPEIIVTEDDRISLAGIDSLYLGQPNDEALAALAELCPKTMDYNTGEIGESASFRGCVFSEPKGEVRSVRVGFWPKIDDRLATLEVKRADIELEAVRERFRDFVDDELTVDLLRSGLLEMRSTKYQLMADTDDGPQGPTHITMGYSPKYVDEHGLD